MNTISQVQFTEVQRRLQWWVWLILGGIDLLFLFAFYKQIIQGKPFEDNPMSNWGLILVLLLMVVLTVSFLFIKLETYINEDGVYYRYFPFQFKYKFFSWNEIESASVRKYAPIKEFGGWGYRQRLRTHILTTVFLKTKLLPVNFSNNLAYTVSGNMGLQLTLKTEKKILIGTQKADELQQTLNKLGKNTEEK